mmetsp:Transcript_18985/g.59690  ORF Transcript_18985/g.59690 Transcript_18985/m.59690 type:complete len:287 (+) Transcript_18985:192-1052(+)
MLMLWSRSLGCWRMRTTTSKRPLARRSRRCAEGVRVRGRSFSERRWSGDVDTPMQLCALHRCGPPWDCQEPMRRRRWSSSSRRGGSGGRRSRVPRPARRPAGASTTGCPRRRRSSDAGRQWLPNPVCTGRTVGWLHGAIGAPLPHRAERCNRVARCSMAKRLSYRRERSTVSPLTSKSACSASSTGVLSCAHSSVWWLRQRRGEQRDVVANHHRDGRGNRRPARGLRRARPQRGRARLWDDGQALRRRGLGPRGGTLGDPPQHEPPGRRCAEHRCRSIGGFMRDRR